MTKPKLSDAVTKPGSAATPTATPANTGAGTAADLGVDPGSSSGDGNAGKTDAGQADDADPDAESDDDTDPAGAASDPPSTAPSSGAAAAPQNAEGKTLADYRMTFGHEQGSVYWADATSFSDACAKHIAAQKTTIDQQATRIGELETENAQLAKQVHGEADPVPTGAAKAPAADGVEAFAAGLKLPGQN